MGKWLGTRISKHVMNVIDNQKQPNADISYNHIIIELCWELRNKSAGNWAENISTCRFSLSHHFFPIGMVIFSPVQHWQNSQVRESEAL